MEFSGILVELCWNSSGILRDSGGILVGFNAKFKLDSGGILRSSLEILGEVKGILEAF